MKIKKKKSSSQLFLLWYDEELAYIKNPVLAQFIKMLKRAGTRAKQKYGTFPTTILVNSEQLSKFASNSRRIKSIQRELPGLTIIGDKATLKNSCCIKIPDNES